MKTRILLAGALALAAVSGHARDITHYYSKAAELVSPVEFNTAEVQAVINGEKAAEWARFTPEYMGVRLGTEDSTRQMEARLWPRYDGDVLVGLDYYQYTEVPKMRFYVVDVIMMTAQEVKSPVNLYLGDDVYLFYQLSPDTPDMVIYTYDMLDMNGDPMKWRAVWNGASFDVELIEAETL